MADFTQAYKYTYKQEGGWAMWSQKQGGETYKGIAKVYHSTNPIWKILDDYGKTTGIRKPDMPNTGVVHTKYAGVINKRFNNDPQVTSIIMATYKKGYWDRNNLDSVKDQKVANALYDMVVQHGGGPDLARVALGVREDVRRGAPSLTPKEIISINNRDPNQYIASLVNVRSHYLVKQGLGTERAKAMFQVGMQYVAEKAEAVAKTGAKHGGRVAKKVAGVITDVVGQGQQTKPQQLRPLTLLEEIEMTVDVMLKKR